MEAAIAALSSSDTELALCGDLRGCLVDSLALERTVGGSLDCGGAVEERVNAREEGNGSLSDDDNDDDNDDNDNDDNDDESRIRAATLLDGNGRPAWVSVATAAPRTLSRTQDAKGKSGGGGGGGGGSGGDGIKAQLRKAISAAEAQGHS